MKRSPDSTAQMLALEELRSGTIASLAMMPFGLLFKSMGLRVGHYGPKVGEALFGHQSDPWMPVLLLVQHFVIGWCNAPARQHHQRQRAQQELMRKCQIVGPLP